MAARRPLEPRKRPSQQRSRDTVERILNAATRVLSADGYAAASTTRVAAEAGVSPGSLYQYFPNKDAVVLAVLERFGDRVTAQLTAEMAGNLTTPPLHALDAVLHVLLDSLGGEPEFLRTLVEEIPRGHETDKLATLERRMVDLVQAYLVVHREHIRPVDPSAGAWFVVQAVEQLTVRYVLDEPAIDRDVFVEQLSRLVTGFLRPLRP